MSRPKGALLVIGGSEDRGREGSPSIADDLDHFHRLEILERFVELAREVRSGRGHPRIEIIPTASTIPGEVGRMYRRVFGELGVGEVGLLDVATRADANSEEAIERVRRADAILFSGGDQFRLGTILGCTSLLSAIEERYRNERIIIAGTSAGAMALSATMLYSGPTTEAMINGEVKTSAGLGFLNGAIVDTHFIHRGRFSRLAQAVVANPTCIGLGLGEDTALLVEEGEHAECLGSGMVIIIDSNAIGYTNIAELKEGEPISIEGLRVHVLVRGNGFLIRERRFLSDAKEGRRRRRAKEAAA